MNRLGVVDPDQLPVFAVLEKLDTEAILAARMAKVKEVWTAHDPPNGAAYDVGDLEFDPIRIVQEADAYYEVTLRDRVNAAAKSVTLAYATGSDLDAIASRYPGGVPRLVRKDAAGNVVWQEDDERYRRRIWLSPSTLSPHGLEESYIFWALTADGTLKDASATTIEGTGHVTVTILASGDNPRPSDAQLTAVRAYIADYARKGLTDIVSVLPPVVRETRIGVRLWLFPGPDAGTTRKAVQDSLASLAEKTAWLGVDLTRMAINTACGNVTGVQDVEIVEPQPITCDPRSVVQVAGIDVDIAGRAE